MSHKCGKSCHRKQEPKTRCASCIANRKARRADMSNAALVRDGVRAK